LFSTFSAEFETASPALETSLPTPLNVLQPDKTKANNIETAKIFFITLSVFHALMHLIYYIYDYTKLFEIDRYAFMSGFVKHCIKNVNNVGTVVI
jgi:hypothetical protein